MANANDERGMFIVLEGIDGAGTTTQTARLVERLRADGVHARGTREPSDGPVGSLVRQVLTGGAGLSDVQLFSQLKALNEIKAALQAIGTQPAREAVARVEQLLGHVFQSGKFSQ